MGTKNRPSKRLLLSGIGGSIGTHVMAHIFNKTDWEIVGIESFRHKGLSDRITHMFKEHPEWRDRLTVLTHDLTTPISPVMARKIGKIDYLINMASLSDVEASIVDPVPFVKNNVDLALTMLEYAREYPVESFIQISTDEVYGPLENKDDLGVPEWGVIAPSNPYAASKAAQEAIAFSYWRTYNIPVIITNTMNNFGEMQQSSKFPAMIQNWIAAGKKVTIHGEERDGKTEIGSRSYIHSRNFADALLFILKNLPAHLHTPDAVDRPDRYNITGDRQLDNLELAKLIATLMGKPDFEYEVQDHHKTRPGHDRHYGLDGAKLKGLGWQSPIPFEESLKNVIDWQKQNPEWME